jgi:hypothetical protein
MIVASVYAKAAQLQATEDMLYLAYLPLGFFIINCFFPVK